MGLTTALTGNLVALGTQARNGVEFAIEEINKTGGIAGQPVALSVADTGSSSTGALAVMNRIIDGGPLVIFGSMISPQVFTQTDAVTRSKTPFIVAATNAKITSRGSEWLFRIHVHDGQLAKLLPEYLVTLGMRKPGVMAVADDFGLGASHDIVENLNKLGIAPVAVESYGRLDKDMSQQLFEVRDRGADSLILFGRPADVAAVMKQISLLGLKLTLIGNASIAAQTTLNNLTPAEADGAYALGGMIPEVSTDPKVADWSKRVFERYKVPPDNFTVAYYDAVYLLKGIIEKVGCDKGAIRDGLAATKNWKGMFISYSSDRLGDMAHTLGVYRNQGNKPELIGTMKESGF